MYCFVFLGVENDYISYVHKNEPDNVLFCLAPNFRLRGVKRLAYRFHNSERVNRIISLPFKRIWKSSFLDKKIASILKTETKEICFVFSGGVFKCLQNGVLDYLRETFRGCKVICMFGDKIQLYKRIYPWFDVNNIKRQFDAIFTYNEIDAKEYGFIRTRPKVIDYSMVNPIKGFHPDIIFIGRDKGRLGLLYKIYEECTSAGLECWFYLVEVPEQKQWHLPGLVYGDYMPYEECLSREKSSRCILNIVQEGVSGITLRDYEAIGMNKFLITNGESISKSLFNTPAKIINTNNLSDELSKITAQNELLPWNGSDEYTAEKFYSWLNSEMCKIK